MSKKRKHTPWLVVAAISISILAGLGAYKGARLLADEITTDAEKQAEKAGLFSEDVQGEGEDEVQKLTDEKVKEVDTLISAKEKEIMTV